MASNHEQQITESSQPHPATFLERMAERLSVSARTATVFGTPVHQHDITVIPVAKVRYGFGGGGGASKESAGGGGGGAQVFPIGYIEMKDGTSTFRPIRDSASRTAGIIASGVVAWFVLGRLLKLTSKREPRTGLFRR